MTAKDLLAELEGIVSRLDDMSDDPYFTTKQRVKLENAARYADVVLEEAMENDERRNGRARSYRR